MVVFATWDDKWNKECLNDKSTYSATEHLTVKITPGLYEYTVLFFTFYFIEIWMSERRI